MRFTRLDLLCWGSCLVWWILPPGFSSATQDIEKAEPNKALPLLRLGQIDDPEIHESSGLARSRTNADSIWTINDSGNASSVYLLSMAGRRMATIDVKSAPNIDWEAMCIAVLNDKPHLIIGDVGDNGRKRKSCFLYVLPEPRLEQDQTVAITPTKIEFVYEDGARNCEAISSPDSKTIWLIEKRYVDDKRKDPPGIYTLSLSTTNKPLSVAKRIGQFPIRNVTGMAFSPDGRRLIIRNYLNAHLYVRPQDQTWEETIRSQQPVPISLPIQRQGEAICFSKDSTSVIVTSEIKRQPIWQVDVDLQLKTLPNQPANTRDRRP